MGLLQVRDVETGEQRWVDTSDKTTREVYAPVSYTHLRAHETVLDLVCRLLLEKKNKKTQHKQQKQQKKKKNKNKKKKKKP